MKQEIVYIGFKKSVLLVVFAFLCGISVTLVTHGWLFLWAFSKGAIPAYIVRSAIGMIAIGMISFFHFESKIDLPLKRMAFASIIPLVAAIYLHGTAASFTYLIEDLMNYTAQSIVVMGFLAVLIDKISPIRNN